MGKRLIGAVIAALLGAGCQPEPEACDSVMGNYNATFTYAAGNCTPTPGSAGPFDMTSDQTTATTMQTRVDDMIITEVVKTGCTVRVTRSAIKDNITLWVVEGTLDVESESTLSGPMQRSEWLNNTQVCQGTYDTVMEKLSPTQAPATF